MHADSKPVADAPAPAGPATGAAAAPPREPVLPRLRLGDDRVSVPASALPPARRAEVEAVTSRPTLRRPLVVRRVDAPVTVYRRLLDELPLAAEVVQRLGAGTYTIAPEAEGIFRIDDGHGASARVERLLAAPGVRVYLAQGAMEVPMLPTVRGTGIITLRYEPLGDEATLTGGQIYFRLENRVLHAVVRAVVPLVYGAIDAKVRHLTEAAIRACRHVAASERGA